MIKILVLKRKGFVFTGNSPVICFPIKLNLV